MKRSSITGLFLASLAFILGYSLLCQGASYLLPSEGRIKTPFSGKRGAPVVALTFDDVPDDINTPKILDILKVAKVRATFFVVGRRAAKFPSVIKRIHDEGHEIGNHTYSHPELNSLGDRGIESELSRTQSVIEQYTGIRPVFFRPPYGEYNHRVISIAGRLGLKVVLWDVDPKDWTGISSDKILARLRKSTRAGSVILLHGTRTSTVQMLPELLRWLKNRGFQIETLSGWYSAATGRSPLAGKTTFPTKPTRPKLPLGGRGDRPLKGSGPTGKEEREALQAILSPLGAGFRSFWNDGPFEILSTFSGMGDESLGDGARAGKIGNANWKERYERLSDPEKVEVDRNYYPSPIFAVLVDERELITNRQGILTDLGRLRVDGITFEGKNGEVILASLVTLDIRYYSLPGLILENRVAFIRGAGETVSDNGIRLFSQLMNAYEEKKRFVIVEIRTLSEGEKELLGLFRRLVGDGTYDPADELYERFQPTSSAQIKPESGEETSTKNDGQKGRGGSTLRLGRFTNDDRVVIVLCSTDGKVSVPIAPGISHLMVAGLDRGTPLLTPLRSVFKDGHIVVEKNPVMLVYQRGG